MSRIWAKLDNNRIVTELVVADEELIISGRFGLSQNFVETSYTGAFRKNYAGIGYSYDMLRNAFIPPKPYPSWVLNEDTCRWNSPIAAPADGLYYNWDEDSLSWVVVPGLELVN